MPTRPLFIDDDVRENVNKVIAHAMEHVITIDNMLDIRNGAPPPGDVNGYSIEIPIGFRCVFTIEDQPDGKMRHLSVSIPHRDLMPNPSAVELIMDLFGFVGGFEECHVWKEDTGKRNALNVLQRIV